MAKKSIKSFPVDTTVPDNVILITVEQFAQDKAITKQSVYNNINNDTLKTVKRFGKTLIIVDEETMGWKPRQGKRNNLLVKGTKNK